MNWGPRSSFCRLRPWPARGVLIVAAALAAFGAWITVSPLGNNHAQQPASRPSDVLLYRGVVDRMAEGAGYYEAMSAEMQSRGYPTRSLFNWRMPLPHLLIGNLPSPLWGKAILGGLALLVFLLAFEALARESAPTEGKEMQRSQKTQREERAERVPGTYLEVDPSSNLSSSSSASSVIPSQSLSLSAVLVSLLLTGPLLLCVLGEIFLMPVVWAGVLMALSVCCYGVSRPLWGVVCGLAAVFCRELAMPYCLLAAALAWHAGRRGELLAWCLGLGAWAVYFALHAWQAAQWIPPDALAHPHSWLRFGGLGFLLATVQINAYLLLLPQWVTALYFVAAVVGLAGWGASLWCAGANPVGPQAAADQNAGLLATPYAGGLGRLVALTLAGYVVAFGCVGQEFNQYWGSLTAPLWCFGVAKFPSSLADLWHAAMPNSERVCSSSSRYGRSAGGASL